MTRQMIVNVLVFFCAGIIGVRSMPAEETGLFLPRNHPLLAGQKLAEKVYQASKGKAPLVPIDAAQTRAAAFEVSLNGKWFFFPFPSLESDKITGIKWEEFYVPGPWGDVNRDYNSQDIRRWNPRDKSMAAWYAVRFFIPENYRGKVIKLYFGTIYLYSQVYLNGKMLAEHTVGGSPFTVDITREARIGETNVLNIFLIDQGAGQRTNEMGAKAFFAPMMSGYYGLMFSPPVFEPRHGIWQGVKLQVYPRTFIDNTYIRTSVRNKTISIAQAITNSGLEDTALTIQNTVFDDENMQKEVKRLSPREIKVSKGGSTNVEIAEPWENADYWIPRDPKLYYLQSRLYQGNILIDERITRFGFREFWIEGKDFILNGKKIRLQGMSIGFRPHERSSWQEKEYVRLVFEACKNDLGYNYLRLWEPCPVVLDAADEVGLLVEAVSPLIVSGAGALFEAGGETFLRNAEIEFSAWIKRDRNHPCVVIWGMENEWAYNWNEGNLSDKAFLILNKLREFALRWDKSRLINYEGALAFPSADFCHFHSGMGNLFLNEILYNSWNKSGKRPFVGGELSIYSVSSAYDDHDISDNEELSKVLAENCERHIVAGRLAGISGICLHAVDDVIFASPYKERKVLADGRVVQGQNMHNHFGTKFYTSDWVNPGWAKNCPEYILNEPIASILRKDFSEIWVWIKERSGNYYSGEKAAKTIFVCNDGPDDRELKSVCELFSGERSIQRRENVLNLKNCEETNFCVAFDLPAENSRKAYRLAARVFEGDTLVSEDTIMIKSYPHEKILPPTDKKIVIYDKTGILSGVFAAEVAGYKEYEKKMNLSGIDLLIIGKHSVDEELGDRKEELEQYVRSGGKIVVFQQNNPRVKLLPVNLFIRPGIGKTGEWGTKYFNMPPEGEYNGGRFTYIRAKTHPIFNGIEGTRLSYFRAGDEKVFCDGFANPLLLSFPLYQNLRVLSGCLKSGDMLEYFLGKGSYLLCQMNLADNLGIDPVATRLFSNIISYMTSEKSRLPETRTLVIGKESGKLLKELNAKAEFSSSPEDKDWKEFDLVMIGSDVPGDVLEEKKKMIAEYVKAGGRVFFFPRSKPFSIGDLGAIGMVKKASTGTAKVEPDDLTQGLRGRDFYRYDIGVRTDYLMDIPEGIKAKILIVSSDFYGNKGFLKSEEKPMLARIPDGKGEYIVNQILFGTGKKERSLNLLSVLLTNLGVCLCGKEAVTVKKRLPENVECIKAGKVVIDGELDEWTRDVSREEDKLRIKGIPYRHARPIAVTFEMAVKEEGLKAPADNSDCSAIVYTMWDEENFYIAAKVIDAQVCFTKMKGEPLHYADTLEFFLDYCQSVITLQRNGEEILYIGGYSPFRKDGGTGKTYSNGEDGISLKIKKTSDLGSTVDMELLGKEMKGKNGYVVEAAIPWRLLVDNRNKIRPGILFQFAVGLDDSDDEREGSPRKSQIFFPKGWIWRENDTYANLVLTEEW